MAGWHANVDEHKVGAVFARELDQLGAIAGLTQNLEALPGQQAGEAFAEQDVVLGEDNADRLRRLIARTTRPVSTRSHRCT